MTRCGNGYGCCGVFVLTARSVGGCEAIGIGGDEHGFRVRPAVPFRTENGRLKLEEADSATSLREITS